MPSKPGTKPKPRALSPQGHRFVLEYVKDFNGTQAAIRAGYAPSCAPDRASVLLKHPGVAPYIKECLDEIEKAKREQVAKAIEIMTLASERTLQVVADTAYFDPRRFVRKDGSTKNLTELDDQSAMAVAGFETETKIVNRKKVVSTTYRLVNRLTALDMAAKVLGDYAKDNEQKTSPAAEALRGFFEHLHAGGGGLPYAASTSNDGG